MTYEIPDFTSAFWMRRREANLLGLFRRMAREVPAYADFLKKHRVDPSKIRTFRDFASVPIMSKANYLREYPLESLAWKGRLDRGQVFTVTSGSTGAPFYFPRTDNVNRRSTAFHKIFLDHRPYHRKESTLIVVGFGMGAWIGGVLTYQAFKNITDEDHYPISIFTPGANKKEIFEGLRRLAPKFAHVVLCGYPPFIKDIIDEGAGEGIDWKAMDLRIMFAAEAFSEEFRDHVARIAGIEDVFTGTANIYGSADLGTMAMETPFSIAMRRAALKNKGLYGALFGTSSRLPTLAQFDPDFTNFESVEGEILCSGDSAVPLLRYAIGDHGSVISFDDAVEAAAAGGIDTRALARALPRRAAPKELPFVAVYERSDLSTKLYGAIIYPEHVKRAMYARGVARHATGRFTMATRVGKNHDQYLEINAELRPKVKPSAAITAAIAEAVARSLLQYNAEYAYLAGLMPDRVRPRVRVWPHGYAEYFGSVGKQKWVEAAPVATPQEKSKPLSSHVRT